MYESILMFLAVVGVLSVAAYLGEMWINRKYNYDRQIDELKRSHAATIETLQKEKGEIKVIVEKAIGTMNEELNKFNQRLAQREMVGAVLPKQREQR